jgi:hypothetical protein
MCYAAMYNDGEKELGRQKEIKSIYFFSVCFLPFFPYFLFLLYDLINVAGL